MKDANSLNGRLALDSSGLKRHRKRLGLSQEALAQHCFDRRLCVSIASIKRAESGKPVLYRTARHLATVYDVDVETLAASSGDVVEEPRLGDAGFEDDAPRSVIRLVAVGSAMPTTFDALIERFGGMPLPATDLSRREAVFGVPRAYRSDALRCMRCAWALLEERRDSANPVARLWIDARQWPLGEAPMDPTLPAGSTGETPSVWTERSVAVQLTESFEFDEGGQGFLRCARSLDDQATRLDLIGRYFELGQLKSALDITCPFP
ncbi:helix-turn-helix domain-containing protein [Billgrantia endophytica]|uniref:helix-turn-helix domain-containing protein n=1 Tax=Billgrantia endophytica TaxID=2033802 RepID=UPI001F0CA6FA|nr:helix-turn-helix transcriptional regulator [Halomonas endophytica]